MVMDLEKFFGAPAISAMHCVIPRGAGAPYVVYQTTSQSERNRRRVVLLV